MTLALLDDAVLLVAAGVSAASVVVLIAFLARYRVLTTDANKSVTLAKDVWDSMNARLSVMDARIIDVMAKVDVASVRVQSRAQNQTFQAPSRPIPPPPAASSPATTPVAVNQPVVRGVRTPEPGEGMELRILRALVEGPGTSNQIMAIIGRSREHTARLMKLLYESGLVVRNDRERPFVYEITEAGRRHLEGA